MNELPIEDYFKSLTSELVSLKNRVRFLIGNQHWGTDGAWKETLVKNTIRRCLPSNRLVGSGFVKNSRSLNQSSSGQIDILVYSDQTPILFQDGDVVVVPHHDVYGIIEVKTKIDSASKLTDYVAVLSERASYIKEAAVNGSPASKLFVGLMAFDGDLNLESIAPALREVAGGDANRVVNHVAIGCHNFVKFWDKTPDDSVPNMWRAYCLEYQSFGYFLHNLLDHTCRVVQESTDLYFPKYPGKEIHKVGSDVPLR